MAINIDSVSEVTACVRRCARQKADCCAGAEFAGSTARVRSRTHRDTGFCSVSDLSQHVPHSTCAHRIPTHGPWARRVHRWLHRQHFLRTRVDHAHGVVPQCHCRPADRVLVVAAVQRQHPRWHSHPHPAHGEPLVFATAAVTFTVCCCCSIAWSVQAERFA